MEQAADTAEAAAVDRYFSWPAENISVPDCLWTPVKDKFHYTGPTGPARTRTDFVGDPHGPTEFLRDPGRSGPCGSARIRSGPVGPV